METSGKPHPRRRLCYGLHDTSERVATCKDPSFSGPGLSHSNSFCGGFGRVSAFHLPLSPAYAASPESGTSTPTCRAHRSRSFHVRGHCSQASRRSERSTSDVSSESCLPVASRSTRWSWSEDTSWPPGSRHRLITSLAKGGGLLCGGSRCVGSVFWPHHDRCRACG